MTRHCLSLARHAKKKKKKEAKKKAEKRAKKAKEAAKKHHEKKAKYHLEKKKKALAKAERAKKKQAAERKWKNVKVRKCRKRYARWWANCTAHPISWYTNCKGGGRQRVTWRRCGFMNAGGQYLCQKSWNQCWWQKRRI